MLQLPPELLFLIPRADYEVETLFPQLCTSAAITSGKYNSKLEPQGKFTRYYPSGSIYDVITYENGKTCGVYTQFWDNAKIRMTCKYTDGKREGKKAQYDVYGYVTSTCDYIDGKKDGAEEHFEDRMLESRTHYKAGKKHGRHVVFNDPRGDSITHHPPCYRPPDYRNGVTHERYYKQGLLDGLYVNYTRNGGYELYCTYKQGKLHGLYTKNELYSGNIKCTFRDGELHGECIDNRVKNNPITWEFINGKLVGREPPWERDKVELTQKSELQALKKYLHVHAHYA